MPLRRLKQNRWIITLSRVHFKLSKKEKETHQKKEIIKKLKDSSIYKDILKKFPDAELIDIKTIEKENKDD